MIAIIEKRVYGKAQKDIQDAKDILIGLGAVSVEDVWNPVLGELNVIGFILNCTDERIDDMYNDYDIDRAMPYYGEL